MLWCNASAQYLGLAGNERTIALEIAFQPLEGSEQSIERGRSRSASSNDLSCIIAPSLEKLQSYSPQIEAWATPDPLQQITAYTFQGGYNTISEEHLISAGTLDQLAVFGQVVLIDLVLAADNAIVIGALAAGLPVVQRRRVILIGIGSAFALRVVFALGVGQLLNLVGLIFAGGLLLLWVAWKMWRELGQQPVSADPGKLAVPRSFAGAALSVALADVSMSLDNVLAVAGAARQHPVILIVGLVLSVALMGLAANLIAKYIDRYRWIGFVGLAVIVYVAIKMILDGWNQLAPHLG